jgi:ataxin-10
LAATGFSYLKRDLVRLLGILCHERKAVQDSVRVCGGLEIVMNLCVVDERNPCELFCLYWRVSYDRSIDIREHAIFTLRNLLIGNPENQAVVDAFQLTRDWDKESVFL